MDELIAEWETERPELDSSALGVVVRVQLLGKLFSANAEEALQALGLKLWEYDVLSALRRNAAGQEMPASALARASMLTSGTITTRIDGLEARQLVERLPDPNDRRGVIVRLTDEGRTLIDRAIGTRLKNAEEMLGKLGLSERERLSVGLRKILSSLTDDQA